MRTVINFEYTAENFWDVVSQWQSKIDWQLASEESNSKLFQKESLLAGPKMNILVKKDGNNATIEAWLQNSKLNQTLTLEMTEIEEPIDTKDKSVIDNIVGVVPKTTCRSTLNQLLGMLSQPSIS